MRQPDPHDELGVPADATLQEIRSAFRRRLREHHPDTRAESAVPQGDPDQALQRTLAAYAALRDRRTGPRSAPVRVARRPDSVHVPVRVVPPARPLVVTPVRWSPFAGDAGLRLPATLDTGEDLRLFRWLLDDGYPTPDHEDH
jgi:hypothetical protein